MNSYRQKILPIVSILLLAVCHPSWAELSVTVDRQVLSSNETLQMVVRYSDQALEQPDFSPLQRDFEILANNQQQQFSWINGKSESYTDWKLTLLPKRSGTILIPSLTYKKDISNALEITVHTSGSGKANQPVYTETVVDKSEVYIQEQIVLTQRLYSSLPLQDLSLSKLDIPNTSIHSIGEHQFKKIIAGTTYLVVEVKYALFPHSSGKLTIPAMRFGGYKITGRSRFDLFSSRGNRLFSDTEPQTVEVMAKPAHIATDQWMPSSHLSLSEKWSQDLNKLAVGEPVTRTISIRAQGLTGAQIQPLTIAENEGYKSYPDQPKIEQQINDKGIVGIRTETIALVPNHSGEISFPAIEVTWWDTHQQRMQTSRLPSQTVQVSINTQTDADSSRADSNSVPTISKATTVQTQAAQPSKLLRWSLALNALLISMLVGLLLSHRRQGPRGPALPRQAITDDRINLKQQFDLIEKQADAHNLIAMRDSILNWGQKVFADRPPTTLKQLAQQLDDTELQAQFQKLDQQLYQSDQTSTEQAIDITGLIRCLKQHAKHLPTGNKKQKTQSGLQPLYPDHN